MATLFKPDRPYPLPADAEVIERDGKPHARRRENGKTVYFPLTADGRQYLKPAEKWAAEVRFANGMRKRVRFSPNRDASAAMLADLLKRIENEKAGVRCEYADFAKRPVASLLEEYERSSVDRGNTAKQAVATLKKCERVFEGCGFVVLADLDATVAERWLADCRRMLKADGGIGARTSNHYVTALKAFGNWLVKARRSNENPFRHVSKVNADVDIRHERRPLTDEEFDRLLNAARHGEEFRCLAGPARAMLYFTAAATGLRASELASLTPASFRLDALTPTVTVAAAYSKHRREDTVPLHPALVEELRGILAGMPLDGPLWPGKWAKNNEAGDMIRRDLENARAAWIAEARSDPERDVRTAADFLTYRDSAGRVADFHALRHRFITELVMAGVAPKDAKELARHSTITLTMDRYAHVGIRDTAAAVAKLTLPANSRPDVEPVALRATGTDGKPVTWIGRGDEGDKGDVSSPCELMEHSNTGAATGAAASGNSRELPGANEESCTVLPFNRQLSKVLENVGDESNSVALKTIEETALGANRTHDLQFRNQKDEPQITNETSQKVGVVTGGSSSGSSSDADLSRLCEAWPTLSGPVRRAILAMLEVKG
jgi:integrase